MCPPGNNVLVILGNPQMSLDIISGRKALCCINKIPFTSVVLQDFRKLDETKTFYLNTIQD